MEAMKALKMKRLHASLNYAATPFLTMIIAIELKGYFERQLTVNQLGCFFSLQPAAD